MGERQIGTQSISSLLAKLDDPDADLRYMSLNDLYSILTSAQVATHGVEGHSATEISKGLLKAIDDHHGDVQNMALKWCVTSVLEDDGCLIVSDVN